MKLNEQNIMFLTRTMALGGTENVILQLCEILKPNVNKIVVCSAGGVNEKKLFDMNIKHYKINDFENKNPIAMINNYLSIKRIIKREKITIIHSHHRMAALFANLCSKKSIIKIANAHNTFYNKKILTKIAYRNTDIIAVGEQVKKNIINYFKIEEKNVRVIHNSIKPFNQKIAIEKQIRQFKDNGYTVVANVGRLSEQKGMEYFIEACNLLKNKLRNIKYLIIGSGKDEKRLKDMVNKYKMEEDILFLGFRNDIQNLLSQVDFVVLSSLWEGLPLTPIEAFSVGKTVIGTAVDGTPEIIRDNIDGCLVEPKNPVAIADKIEFLIKNPNKKCIFEKNAKERFMTEFSFDQMADKYLSTYLNIVNKNEKKLEA